MASREPARECLRQLGIANREAAWVLGFCGDRQYSGDYVLGHLQGKALTLRKRIECANVALSVLGSAYPHLQVALLRARHEALELMEQCEAAARLLAPEP